MKIVETEAKSIIVKSKLPDADYVVNPYTGCEFACSYCYASFMGRFVGEPITDWGEYVYVKKNAVELFQRELQSLRARDPCASIFLSSVTDAWQPAERKYRLARGILTALVDSGYEGTVSVLTKSPIILDDINLLEKLRQPDIGVTITSPSSEVARILERRAPSSRRRLEILEKLNKASIRTYAFVGPLLPHFRFAPNELKELFEAIRSVGTTELYVELMNMSSYIQSRVNEEFDRSPPVWLGAYRSASAPENRKALTDLVMGFASELGMHVRLGGVLDHMKATKQPVDGGAIVTNPS